MSEWNLSAHRVHKTDKQFCKLRFGVFRRVTIKDFSGKTAFITGAASGIGLGMAKAFADQGMNLALGDINLAALDSAMQELQHKGVKVMALEADVTDRQSMAKAAEIVSREFPSLDIICANAGVSGRMGPLEEADPEDWDWILDVNLKGVINTVQTFMPLLLKHRHNHQEGHIVLTSSISGLRVYEPSRGQGMYNTTKFAVVGYGEALAVDLKQYGIGVTLLCPGVVNTPISESSLSRPEKYGGAIEPTGGRELSKAAHSGTDPYLFGKWVVKAVKENLLYAITHPQDRELVEGRNARIIKAFDFSSDLTS